MVYCTCMMFMTRRLLVGCIIAWCWWLQALKEESIGLGRLSFCLYSKGQGKSGNGNDCMKWN